MIGDLFDSPWKVALIVILFIVLFGSKKLPGAARSLGQSMRILKREVQGLSEDDEPASSAPARAPGSTATAVPAPAELTAAPQVDQQAQIDALRQQVRDLQRAAAMDTPVPAAPAVQAAVSAESQRTQQSS
jgi:sec-independent protein translocase protein TatA